MDLRNGLRYKWREEIIESPKQKYDKPDSQPNRSLLEASQARHLTFVFPESTLNAEDTTNKSVFQTGESHLLSNVWGFTQRIEEEEEQTQAIEMIRLEGMLAHFLLLERLS